MMRVITRVEKMMVECSVEPIVEELNWTHMKKSHHYCTISSPHREVCNTWNEHIANIEQKAVEEDLVIPVIPPIKIRQILIRSDSPMKSNTEFFCNISLLHAVHAKTEKDKVDLNS